MSTKKPSHSMSITDENQDDFFDKLRESMLILATSSPDKRVDYRTLFNALHTPSDAEISGQGANLHFTDIGQLNIAPRKTPEKDGSYHSHAIEKASAGLDMLNEQETSIRSRLASGELNNAESIPLVLMTEDSGWELNFDHIDDPDVKHAFLREVQLLLDEQLPGSQRDWLFNHIEDSFPGPNLKPFQEHLEGGFPALMNIIYDAAEAIKLDDLRFTSTCEYGFAFQETGDLYCIDFDSQGCIIDRESFNKLVDDLPLGESIDSSSVHIPDGQQKGHERTEGMLKATAFTTHSTDTPYDHPRRAFAEWVQNGIGAKAPEPNIASDIHIAYVSPAAFDGQEQPESSLLHLNNSADYTFVSLPTAQQLRMAPNSRVMNSADMVILRADPVILRDGLTYDPNLLMLDYMAVNTEVDPLSMTTPVILDNRNNEFDHALSVMRDAYQEGRFMGSFPFLIANSTEQLQNIVDEQAMILDADKYIGSKNAIELVPDDGVLSVFVAGGHANNNERDVEEATNLGYYLARQGIRIVSGGGQIDGSMGAVHTGFIQYHLDQLVIDDIAPAMQTSLKPYFDEETGCYDAAKIIENAPELLDTLANDRFIPRDMFYAYSTQALVEMESPNGKPPAATVYQDTGNRVIRLDGLLSAGTHLFMPGGIGTDEELMHSIRKRIDSIYAANDDNHYHDGTPDSKGQIIIYNRNNQNDSMLKQLGLMDDNGDLIHQTLSRYNIKVIDRLETLEHTIDTRADEAQSWLSRLQAQRAERHTERAVA